MKKIHIVALAIILIVLILIVPKMLKEHEGQVKYKVVKEEEIPEKITEMLPKYLMEERALTCKYRDDIYVVVTRGEKSTKGFLVEINEIISKVMNNFSDQFRYIFKERFIYNKSQAEIAKILRVSQMTVSRAEKNIIEQFKSEVQK